MKSDDRKHTNKYLARKEFAIFLKKKKRKDHFRSKRTGELKYRLDMKHTAESKGFVFDKNKKPQYPANIKYLKSFPKLFSEKKKNNTNGHIYIPETFSLLDNYKESFDFLKQLFDLLEGNNVSNILLDYKNCTRIDPDASMCMDIMLGDFIKYYTKCENKGYDTKIEEIKPLNYENESVKEVLFSIGAYSSLRGVKINFPNCIPLPIIINDNSKSGVWSRNEVDLTNIVEYIKRCLEKLHKTLTTNAIDELYKVIGEIMSNSLEHSTLDCGYAIGFFKYDNDKHVGVFNFSIFNYGDTIYKTFKKDSCPSKVMTQMAQLSESYTKKGWFKKADFEEETLWTLYALQDEVTSKDTKRGNGSIQYIENFFKLKGDMKKDSISRLVIMSGNTRIEFDGTYSITEKEREFEKSKYKIITFNDSNNLHDKPDKKFVTFVPHFFPGTMVSARILIKSDNIK